MDIMEQQDEKLNNARRLSNILCVCYIAILIILSLIFGIKCGLLVFSISSLLMYAHISLTTLANAFIGRAFNEKNDVAWKLILLLLSAVGFGIYFSL